MFYLYSQNNSGGFWKPPAHYVIIEADEARFANLIAEDYGIYFDGCDSEMDCSCCGDRWYDPSDVTEEPTIYGTNVNKIKKFPFTETDLEDGFKKKTVMIVYKDKQIEKFSYITDL
jgi:hypothetical protein